MAVAFWMYTASLKKQLADKEEEDRTARRGERAEWALAQAELALREDDAAVQLEQAARWAAEEKANHLEARLARCRAALDLLREFDRIDQLEWSVIDGRRFGLRAALAAWPEAFRRAGVVVGQTSPPAAAERIRGYAIAERLIGESDRWFRYDRSPALLAVLNAVDPDSYRVAVRTALRAGADDRLRELTGRPDAERQPVRFAVVLGALSAVPQARREHLLLTAHRHRPDDFFAVMALGDLSAMALNNLGLALTDKGSRRPRSPSSSTPSVPTPRCSWRGSTWRSPIWN